MLINELKERFDNNYRRIIILLSINYFFAGIILVFIYFDSIYGLGTVVICLLYNIYLNYKWKVNTKLKGTLYRKLIDYPLLIIYIIMLLFLITK